MMQKIAVLLSDGFSSLKRMPPLILGHRRVFSPVATRTLANALVNIDCKCLLYLLPTILRAVAHLNGNRRTWVRVFRK
jgi:hypothetical protein